MRSVSCCRGTATHVALWRRREWWRHLPACPFPSVGSMTCNTSDLVSAQPCVVVPNEAGRLTLGGGCVFKFGIRIRWPPRSLWQRNFENGKRKKKFAMLRWTAAVRSLFTFAARIGPGLSKHDHWFVFNSFFLPFLFAGGQSELQNWPTTSFSKRSPRVCSDCNQ